ncbi:MAG: hypothetical protein QOF89_4487 [Acidobacteriota bacterium]|jgi:hypothetical protein|nr:hypothetical protein [Acidobacteriota bacterium]
MSEPNTATRKDHRKPTPPGETGLPPRAESNPDTGTTGTGSSEEPKGPGSLDVELD